MGEAKRRKALGVYAVTNEAARIEASIERRAKLVAERKELGRGVRGHNRPKSYRGHLGRGWVHG